ncbi:MAG: hypothetical protein PVG03_10870 [Desulfarculaceae bacterium]|jgi:hypothetical protein
MPESALKPGFAKLTILVWFLLLFWALPVNAGGSGDLRPFPQTPPPYQQQPYPTPQPRAPNPALSYYNSFQQRIIRMSDRELYNLRNQLLSRYRQAYQAGDRNRVQHYGTLLNIVTQEQGLRARFRN